MWLGFTYLGSPDDSLGAKCCISEMGKKKEREEKRREGKKGEGTLLWLSDSW